MTPTPFLYPKAAKELVKNAGRGWHHNFEDHLPAVQQHTNAQEYCTHALFAVLQGLGDPKRGQTLSLRSENDSDFEQCISILRPLADCAVLVQSPQLLRVAQKYAACGSKHYSLFVLHVRSIFEDTNTAVSVAWDCVFQQYDNTQALIVASAAGNASEVKRLIPLAAPSADGNMALCMASREGQLECVQLLCAVSKFEAPALLEKPGGSPLQWAAQNGRLECVRVLLTYCHSSTHLPSAVIAARHGHFDIIQLLAPLLKSKHAEHVLMASAVGGNMEITRLLEQLFAKQDLKYGEALKTAAASGHVEMVQHLLNHASPEQIAHAFTNAAHHGHADCLKILMPHSSRQDIGVALEQLTQLPARQNGTSLTPQQKICVQVLAEHCDAQAVLTTLQTAHPQEPNFWETLEECLRAQQRILLLDGIENSKRVMAQRKM